MAFIQSPSIVTANLTLLVDPANLKSYDSRENLLQYSSQIYTSPWGLGNILNSGADSTAAPDGTLTADKLIENTSAGVYHYHSQSLTKPAEANTYTYSVYAKDAGRAVMGVRVESSGNGAVYAVDLSNGTVQLAAGTYGTSFSNPVGSVTSVGNGWYRMSLTVTTDAATSIFVQNYLYSKTAGSSVYTGDGVSGVYVWGAQFERATTPQTYTPTTSTAVTRSATMADIIGQRSGSLINSPGYSNNVLKFTESNSQYVEVSGYVANTTFINRTVSAWFKCTAAASTSTSMTIATLMDTTNNTNNPHISIGLTANGTSLTSTTWGPTNVLSITAVPVQLNQWYNVAVVENHDSGNNISMYLNGVLQSTSAKTEASYNCTTNAMRIAGQKVGGSFYRYFTGEIGHVIVNHKSLTDAEIKQNFNALRGRYGI